MDSNTPARFSGSQLTASLSVNDLAASLRWYRDIVGFTVKQEHAREGKLVAVSLKADEVELLLGQDDGAKGAGRAKGEGFSLMIRTTQDVDAVAKRIKDAGGTLESEPASMPWGARVFRLKDPDGFKLVISSLT